jgi:exopolysaccharide production protein ExoQ
VFSDSITSLIAILLTLGVLYAFRIVRRQYGMPLPLLIVIGLTVGGFIAANRETVTGLFGRSSDITGRTELWSWVVKMIASRPWLGFGFSGFWKGGSSESAFLEKAIGWSPMYSHNGYLEILLSLGLAGFLLFVWFALVGLKRAVKQAETAQSTTDLWPLAFLVYFLFHNFGECTILWQNSLEWAMCISVVVGAEPRLRAPYESVAEETEPELMPATEYV